MASNSAQAFTLPMPPGYIPSRLLHSTRTSGSGPSGGSSDFSDESEITGANQLVSGHGYDDSSSPEDRKREFGHQMSNDWTVGNYSSFPSFQPSFPHSYPHGRSFDTGSAYSHPLSQPDENKSYGGSERTAKLIQLKKENKYFREQIVKLNGQLSVSDKRFEQLLASTRGIQVDPGPPRPLSSSGSTCTTGTASSSSEVSSESASSRAPDAAGFFMALLKDAREKDSQPAVTREQFPTVVYWNKSDYLKDNKNGREYLRTTRGPDAGTVGFLEDEKGNVVSETEQATIRTYSRTLALTLLKFGLAPTTWGRCTDPALEYFYCKMRAKFPIFRYCSDNWKADTFMSMYYSQWSDRPQDDSAETSSNLRIKQETQETLTQLATVGNLKRPSSNANAPFAKRKKIDKNPQVNSVNLNLDASASAGTPGPIPVVTEETLPGPGPASGLAVAMPVPPPLDSAKSTAFAQPVVVTHPSYVASDLGLSHTSSPLQSVIRDTTRDTMVTSVSSMPAMQDILEVVRGPAHTASSMSTKLPNPIQQLMDAVQAEQAKQLCTLIPVNKPTTPVTSAAPQQPESHANESAADTTRLKKKRKEADPNSIMRPSANSSSARNLYAMEWCRQHRGGKRGEFAAAWSAIEATKDPLLEEYKKRSNDVKAAKKKAGGATSKPGAPNEDDADED